jgi:hypothetical protein
MSFDNTPLVWTALVGAAIGFAVWRKAAPTILCALAASIGWDVWIAAPRKAGAAECVGACLKVAREADVRTNTTALIGAAIGLALMVFAGCGPIKAIIGSILGGFAASYGAFVWFASAHPELSPTGAHYTIRQAAVPVIAVTAIAVMALTSRRSAQ